MTESPLLLAWEAYDGRIPRPEARGWQNAICPLHDDRSPSARVSLERQAWTCNSCVEGGDLYDLIKLKEGVGFVEAKQIAQTRFGAEGGPTRPAKSKTPKKPWKPPWL